MGDKAGHPFRGNQYSKGKGSKALKFVSAHKSEIVDTLEVAGKAVVVGAAVYGATKVPGVATAAKTVSTWTGTVPGGGRMVKTGAKMTYKGTMKAGPGQMTLPGF